MDQNYFLIFYLFLCFSSTHQELLGLKQVPPRSFPYVADIGSHEWCQGVLITSNFVLANARCVISTSDVIIYLGWYSYPEDQNLLNESDIQIYTASKVIPHPDYQVVQQYWLYHNDIALVKLPQPVLVTSGVKPIRLADPKTFMGKNLTDQYGIVFGWWPSKYLSAATVQIRSHEECRSIFGKKYLEDRHFCAKWPLGDRLCAHHSLPLEVNGKLLGIQQDDPQNVIEDCMQFEYKFINILFYYDWIKNNSDLEEYINGNPDTGTVQFPFKVQSSTTKSTIGDNPDKSPTSNFIKEPPVLDTNFPPRRKCKIDFKQACPNNEEG